MLFMQQPKNTTISEISEAIKKELISTLLNKGIMVNSLDIEVKQGNVNISVSIKE